MVDEFVESVPDFLEDVVSVSRTTKPPSIINQADLTATSASLILSPR